MHLRSRGFSAPRADRGAASTAIAAKRTSVSVEAERVAPRPNPIGMARRGEQARQEAVRHDHEEQVHHIEREGELPELDQRLPVQRAAGDPAIARESSLQGSWYAAPAPNADAEFVSKYRAAFGTAPAQLASLAYDAVSLVALLSQGPAYHRFTAAALSDPNGFAGAEGIFRFAPDGTAEHGLAILSVTPTGFVVVDPAPTTFVKPGS